MSEIHLEHWSLIAEITDATKRAVHVPIYGLAPKHSAIEAVRFIQEVIEMAEPPFYLLGDSAGAGLALASTQVWLARGGTPPCGLTLISPWLDIGLSDPAAVEVAASDPWLGIEGARHVGRNWARGLALNDPQVSPIFGRLDNLPNMEIYVGDRDLFMPDCRRLYELVGRERCVYHEEPGAIHVYPLLPVPEGRRSRSQLISSIAGVMSE
ncbi:alpha/beta hydrolase fold domain-containing protein [Bradyrhizobium sp. NBAIM02]|nr:alpha/beta hydrolase fold domain-containing protein [Bradyrhizobium sp. NBAIM02]